MLDHIIQRIGQLELLIRRHTSLLSHLLFILFAFSVLALLTHPIASAPATFRTADLTAAKHRGILRHLSRKNFVYPHRHQNVLDQLIPYVRQLCGLSLNC